MELPLNHNEPSVMWIDLNSCFATIEQQANMHLRGKPLVIAAYETANGCVLSPSVEAKRYGVKTGLTVREARLLCRDIIVRDPDPALVRDVHVKFKKIFTDYSSIVIPKSVDEAIIDFAGAPPRTRDLREIAQEIKNRLRAEIGEWISCSIGIATNRFLAKLGAGIHKPDGLDMITHENLREILSRLKLVDLPGINVRYEARLNTVGVFSPIDFLNATEDILVKQVFNGIVGHYWYLRLHGWEIDDVEFKRKSYGQEYSLKEKTADPVLISRILMKLVEKMGRRLRGAGLAAYGIHVACVYSNHTYWHRGRKMERPMYTTAELYRKATLVLNQQPEKKVVARLAVSCYDFSPAKSSQLDMFEAAEDRKRKVSDAMDKINDRYGEFVITPAIMMDMSRVVLDRISFGRIDNIEDLYIRESFD